MWHWAGFTMHKTEFMLAEVFEVTGEWWLPDRPDDKVHGTLRYTHTDIELELSGSLETVPAEDLMGGGDKFKDYPCIHGQSNDGWSFTLLKAAVKEYGATTKYSALFVIAGKHTPGADTLCLTSVLLYCNHLDTFMARGLFDRQDQGGGKDFKAVTIKYLQPDKLSWRIDEIAATLDLEAKVICRDTRTSAELHARSFVTITPDTPKDIDWFVKKVWRFCYLLTLVTDEKVSPNGLRVHVEGEKYPSWLLCRSTHKLADDSQSVTPVFLFHFAHLSKQFQNILPKWFSVNKMMLDAIHLTMDAHRNPEQSMHGRLLLLAHAVEVISRATTPSQYMPAADYKGVISALNGAIPANVHRDHRRSLESRIKYGNEFAFHKRIKLLIKSLTAPAQAIVCKDPGRFARGISDTRNYYTHFTDELRPKALTGAAEYWAAEKLLFLVRILLFKYLGIEEDLIVRRLSEHHRLSQRVFYSKKQPECTSE